MANNFVLLGRQMSEIWRHFGVNQRASVIMGLFVTFAIIGGLLYWSSRPNYRVVYSGMSMKDSAAACEKLEDQHILVKLKDSGRSIYVPAEDVYSARIILAKEGIPKGTSSGFELFEKPKFGLTDFAQRINYQRALQGELERTISAMDGIISARVILVLPKDKIFASDSEKKASASILVNLGSGISLSPSHVTSITRFVGSAVAGLSASAVTITDQQGRLLSHYSDPSESQTEAAGQQLEAQISLESLLSKKAQAMLDKALGFGQSIVKVSADMDFSKVEKRSETYDAEGRVVFDETITSQSTSSPGGVEGGGAGGTATVRVGAPGGGGSAVVMSKTKQENIKTKYKVPSDVEHIVQMGAKIKSLSVSVCVAKGEEKRSPEALEQIEAMISSAVGLVKSAGRMDSIKVVEMEFPPEKETPKMSWWQALQISISAIGKGLTAVILLIMIFAGSRKIIARLSVEGEEVGMPVGALRGGEGAEKFGGPGQQMPGVENMEGSMNYVAGLAEQDPRAIAAWITNVSKSS